MDNLKPCPFCGNHEIAIENEVIHTTAFYHAVCQKCEAQGPDAGTALAAMADWNTRPGEDTAVAAEREESGQLFRAVGQYLASPNSSGAIQILKNAFAYHTEAIRKRGEK